MSSKILQCLCIRDLKVYSSAKGGKISYYHDRMGLEADAVLHLEDGRYALIEIKLGQTEVDEGAQHLNKIERLIKEYNEKEKQIPLRLPDLKIVITGTQYGYRREDGVFVIPLGCLKDYKEQIADNLYTHRNTMSSWENDNGYPDIHLSPINRVKSWITFGYIKQSVKKMRNLSEENGTLVC